MPQKSDTVVVYPALTDISAIESYSQAGFKIIRASSKEKIFWMLKSKQETREKCQENILFNQLAMREPIFHHPDKCGSTKKDLTRLTHEKFWEVGASGNTYSREKVINILLQRYNAQNYIDIWETRDFNLIEIAPDNYLITYTLIQNESRITKRSTIWKKINKQFKIVYHQGTIVSDAA